MRWIREEKIIMEVDQVKEWLDKLIENKNELTEIKKFNSQIFACGPLDAIPLFKGIEIVADLIGAELIESLRDDSIFPYMYEFFYNNVKFVSFSRERLGAYAGAD